MSLSLIFRAEDALVTVELSSFGNVNITTRC